MSTVFGGASRSRDIHDLVDSLQGSSICNESIAGASLAAIDINNIADTIKESLYEHYAPQMNSKFDEMISEDANSARQLFLNNVRDSAAMTTAGTMNESAVMPNLVTLTASIATTMRVPYEAVLHRLFDTRTIEKQIVDIEEVIPTVKVPTSNEEEDLIDALSPTNPVLFVDRTELIVTELAEGVTVPTKDMRVLVGLNPLFRVNRDVRIDHIDAVDEKGKALDPKDISFVKGSIPYFEAMDNTLNIMVNLKNSDGTTYVADLSAKFDFDGNVLMYLRGDPRITKVYFHATVDHREHTHPIYTGFRNNFTQFMVPTRPHIEVSLPQEMRTDISNSIQHFSNTDIVSAMTENITVIASRMEDQRLLKSIMSAHEFEARFPFEAPQNFAYGNLEWIKREFIPFLDHCALKMKNDHNITDCHFRVGVSPYILRVLDTDYTMDKSMTEDSKGSGVINYSIGVKTSTSVFYFISSQAFADDEIHMLLIPNNFKMSQVRTYHYFRYSSFLTDQLRRSDNHTQPAIVYSERNLPIVFEPLQTEVKLTGIPTMSKNSTRYIRRVAA